ncbi:hypothetical protein F4782DRAFT_532572 [Xylaria castorea]|nr:hypothetical protein F4782DRAFT_532572 [Xylaria castorea]
MPSNLDYVAVCARVIVFFLAAINLAIAGLDSAIVHFAIVLRDRARSDLVSATDAVLDTTFISTMENVLANAVVAAIASAIFAIFGALLAVSPSWLRNHSASLVTLGTAQFILTICIVATGGDIADDVCGFQTPFGKFSGNNNFPYYDIMCYGGMAQTGYALLIIALVVTLLVAICTSSGEATRG